MMRVRLQCDCNCYSKSSNRFTDFNLRSLHVNVHKHRGPPAHPQGGGIVMLSKTLQGAAFLAAVALLGIGQAQAQFVPGTGTKISSQSDNFETGNWKFQYNHPKSSREQDDRLRSPVGYSANKKWREGPKRGVPDSIVRVKTPSGGIEGSLYSLAVKSKNTGIPGRPSFQQQQDDLLLATRSIPVSWMPSCVARVYLPAWDEWENRSGAHFGFRADLRTTITEEEELPLTDPRSKGGRKSRRGGLFGNLFRTAMVEKVEPYWPGMFIQFHSKTDAKYDKDSAMIVIRGNRNGNVVPGPAIHQPGWWTLGMSFTSDGAVHYFASPGVDDLTKEDHLSSQYPYGYRAERFTTMFFNVVNKDDGKTWTTEFIIDDPAVYYAKGGSRQARSTPSSNTKRR